MYYFAKDEPAPVPWGRLTVVIASTSPRHTGRAGCHMASRARTRYLMSSRVTSNLTDFGSVFASPDTGRSIDVVQVCAAPAALPTPRIMRPQAHPQAQANNRVTLAFPRFTAKSPKNPPRLELCIPIHAPLRQDRRLGFLDPGGGRSVARRFGPPLQPSNAAPTSVCSYDSVSGWRLRIT
jgi:hypothetical protein